MSHWLGLDCWRSLRLSVPIVSCAGSSEPRASCHSPILLRPVDHKMPQPVSAVLSASCAPLPRCPASDHPSMADRFSLTSLRTAQLYYGQYLTSQARDTLVAHRQ